MFGFGAKKTELIPVFPGQIVQVSEVPDPMFNQKMLGDGFAVIPADDATELEVCAPTDGVVVKVFKTLHAFAMKSTDGLEILVHIGLETVELGGEGFEALVENQTEVTAGQPVIRVDATAIKAKGINLITPVVMTKPKQVSDIKVNTDPGARVVATVTLA